MRWSGRALPSPAREAGNGRQRRGARHVTQAAYVGWSTPDSGHCSARLARQKSAKSGCEQPAGCAAVWSPAFFASIKWFMGEFVGRDKVIAQRIDFLSHMAVAA